MIDPITSPANPRIKLLRSLATNRKERRRERSFVIEGVRLFAEALQSGAEITLVLYDPEHLAETAAGTAILDQIEGQRGAFPTSAALLALAAETVTPQGIVAAVRWPTLPVQPGGLRLVLDAVQDPGNVGTLLRSAEAAGVSDVICLSGTADVFSPKVVRAAMGTHFRLPITQDVQWASVGPELRAAYDHVYALAAEATVPYYAVDWRQPAVIVVGNEAHGLAPEAQAAATTLLSIPMASAVESLNAAVAGSVVLFEAARQRRLGRS